MLRVVLSVALAVALLGAAVPVVEDARTARSGRLVEGELSAVGEAAVDLVAADEPGAAPPRRSLAVAVPDGTLSTAPVAYVAVGGLPDCGTPRDRETTDVLAYRLSGGPPHVRHLPVDLRVRGADGLRADDEPLVLRGDARVTLALVERAGNPTVLVGRGGGGRR